MKSLRMGKVLNTIRRKNGSGSEPSTVPNGDNPETVAAQSVKAFCEAGGPNNSGDEVLYLPPIVDAAESSPQAAAECARLIRKYLKRDYWTRPTYQYNAIMLMRILADNPGPTFTRNVDQKCVDALKELLRNGRDPGVLQILMETLNVFENSKAYDENLAPVIEMWRKEKERAQKAGTRNPTPRMSQQMAAPPANPQPQSYHSQNYFSRDHTQNRQLPNAVELASRLEEARTSAKLLHEVVTNTPPNEVLQNDFMREFADRCTSASRSIQIYMAAENPSPDNDTMESLIDTNEQLQAALSLHQRALLNARKHAGVGVQTDTSESNLAPAPVANGAGSSRHHSPAPPTLDDSDYEPPSEPPRRANGKGQEREYDGGFAGPSRSHSPGPEEDPFRDPVPGSSASGAGGSRFVDEEPRLAMEPFHPGFTATQSYVGRQESAVGGEAMHGAAGASSNIPPPSPEGDEDIYDATPHKNKEPIYRY